MTDTLRLQAERRARRWVQRSKGGNAVSIVNASRLSDQLGKTTIRKYKAGTCVRNRASAGGGWSLPSAGTLHGSAGGEDPQAHDEGEGGRPCNPE